MNPYFGAVHYHTRISKEGNLQEKSSPLESLEHVRDHFGMDFAIPTDHNGYFWDDWEWVETVEANEKLYVPGEFVTLLGFEWTHPVLGHWNVYYRKNTTEMPMICCSPLKQWPVAATLPELIQSLNREVGIENYIIGLNHPASPKCTANLDISDHAIRFVEVINGGNVHTYAGAPRVPEDYIKYGNFVFDALVRGFRIGFLGALDDHSLLPEMSGITGVWADTLDRESLFDALYSRRTFVNTGTRTSVFFSINGQAMGSVIQFGIEDLETVFPLHFEIEIRPSERVKMVLIYDVNGVWKKFLYPKPETDGTVRLQAIFENEFVYDLFCNCYNRCFHVYVQEEDGNMAWGSPVYLHFDAGSSSKKLL